MKHNQFVVQGKFKLEKENTQVQHSVYIGKEKLICSWVVLKDETVTVGV